MIPEVRPGGRDTIPYPSVVAYNGITYLSYVNNSTGAAIAEVDTAGTVTATHTFTTVDGTDLHNNPAVHIKAANPPVTFYAGHDVDNLLRYRIGSQNIESGMAWGAEQTIDNGASVTYAKLYEDNDALFVFFRSNQQAWRMVTSTNWGTSWSAPLTVFNNTAGKFYLRTARSGSVLYCGFQTHADATNADKGYYCELNLATGAITQADGTALGNLDGTGLPVDLSSMDVVFDLASGDGRTYAVYSDKSVLYVDVPNLNLYLATYDSGYTSELVTNMGASWDHATRVAGGTFDLDGSVLYCREINSAWEFARFNGDTYWTSLSAPIIWVEPVIDLDGSVPWLWSLMRIDDAVDYDDWHASLVLLDGPVPNHYSSNDPGPIPYLEMWK